MKTDYTHKYLQVEGHRLAYLDEGTGPPVLLIHGIPTSSLLWREIIPTLTRTHRVIAPDMLNYGQSDKPEHADVSIAAHPCRLPEHTDRVMVMDTAMLAHVRSRSSRADLRPRQHPIAHSV